MKKKLLILLLTVFVISLVGCGKDGNSDSKNEAEESSAAEGASGEESTDKETADEETQYCYQGICTTKMFPHIHVTMDNWQDYFEFVDEYQFGNGEENMDKYMLAKTKFKVRDEWIDEISRIDLNYQVHYTEYAVPGEIDWDNHTVTIDENAEKTYSAHIDDKWYDLDDDASFDRETGLFGSTNERSMDNDRDDYDGMILIWEPEMTEIAEDGYISLKEE